MTENQTHYCSRCLTSFSVDPECCLNLGCQQPKPASGWGRILSEGELFDRCYRIERLLAMGGGGITYLAQEVDESGEPIGSKVAIKALFAHREHGSYLRRLATEAQILQEMNDPHIVSYQGFVHRAGRAPYLVTKFEAGGSLFDHVRRVGTLPARQAAAIGAQICAALHKAHSTGVIHRDLKPENILLSAVVGPDEEPHIRVVDFGIAKVNSSLHSNLTRAGAFVGTPHFASPEQFIGAAITPKSDVYSVGAVLYFCMMGRHLIADADQLSPEDSYQRLLKRLPGQINRPTDPAEDVERMNRVLAKVLCARPDERCSAHELGVLLRAVHDGTSLPDPQKSTTTFDDVPLVVSTEPPQSTPTVETQSTVTSSSPEVMRDASISASQRPPSSMGCALLGVGGMAIGLLGALGLAATWWSQAPSTPETLSPDVPRLTGSETDPATQEDYRLIYETLEHYKAPLQQQCAIPAGTEVLLEVELGAAVDHRSEIVGIVIHQGEGSCIAEHLRGAQVNRHQDHPTRCPKQLAWS